MNYSNKTVLIVGGTSGIGLATAKKFQNANAKLIVAGKNESNLKIAKETLGEESSYYTLDITNVASLNKLYQELVEEKIKIDFLIITAGLGKFGKNDEVLEEDYDLVMNTNVKGTFFAVSILNKLINDGGSIVLLSSFLANQYIPFTSVLSASKIAVETFTKIFAKELSSRFIRVNAVSPGSIKTNFMAVANPSVEQQNALKEVMPKIPLGKRGEPDNIADAILFLTSEEANYINGAILSVDGGL
jgi:NAD(P)-dependent dehydrogenase (short-subunit alcohol dehydrogenase family)